MRRWPVLALVGWSAFVWITRINNALADDAADKPMALTLSASVLALAAASGVILWVRRSAPTTETDRRVWLAFAGWTALVSRLLLESHRECQSHAPQMDRVHRTGPAVRV